MRRSLVLLVVLLAVAPCLFAQKFAIEGGYSFLRLEDAEHANGWEAQPMVFFGKHFAAIGDFTGSYESGGGYYTYLFGPGYVIPMGKSAKANVHYLVGGLHSTWSGNSYLTMAVGGAVDFKVAKHVWLRPAEVDWIVFDDYGYWVKKNVRYGAGVVFMF